MIRRATEKDLPRVNALLRQVLALHAAGRPDIFAENTKKYTDEELLALFKDDSRPIFVSTDEDDTALGYAFCVLEETKDAHCLNDMKTLYIDDICVDEPFRGRGIASGLYAHARAFAKAQGCYHVTLNVWVCNPAARQFYEHMGMIPLKTTMEDIL